LEQEIQSVKKIIPQIAVRFTKAGHYWCCGKKSEAESRIYTGKDFVKTALQNRRAYESIGSIKMTDSEKKLNSLYHTVAVRSGVSGGEICV